MYTPFTPAYTYEMDSDTKTVLATEAPKDAEESQQLQVLRMAAV